MFWPLQTRSPPSPIGQIDRASDRKAKSTPVERFSRHRHFADGSRVFGIQNRFVIEWRSGVVNGTIWPRVESLPPVDVKLTTPPLSGRLGRVTPSRDCDPEVVRPAPLREEGAFSPAASGPHRSDVSPNPGRRYTEVGGVCACASKVVPVPPCALETVLLSRKMNEVSTSAALVRTSKGNSLTCRSLTLSCCTGVSV